MTTKIELTEEQVYGIIHTLKNLEEQIQIDLTISFLEAKLKGDV